MSPNDIKRVVNCVVDYGWPWQWLTDEGFETPSDQSLNALLWQITKYHVVRLAPTHVWDWPIETREGMPCWFRYRGDGWSPFYPWERGILMGSVMWTSQESFEYATAMDMQIVAIHPLNPTMEPPAGWSPENKRILK
jgi:hypothetical protein